MKNKSLPEKVQLSSVGTPERCPVCGKTGISNVVSAPDRFHWRREVYQLKRCCSCSFVWLENPPKPNEMAFHYDAKYHSAVAAAGQGSAISRWRRQRKIVRRYSRSGSLLDIGCSTGAFLGTLKGEAWKLYGIEIEKSTAEQAKLASGAEIFIGDALKAPFGPESFDVITCFDVLEHLCDPRLFLLRILNWLKPHGIFITQLPNIDSWEAQMFGTYWFGLELPRHLSHFTLRSLRYLMKDAGFQEVRIVTPPVSYIQRSLGFTWSGILEKLRFVPTPQSEAISRNILPRIIWKAMRVLLIAPFALLASAACGGASIEGVFRKGEPAPSAVDPAMRR